VSRLTGYADITSGEPKNVLGEGTDRKTAGADDLRTLRADGAAQPGGDEAVAVLGHHAALTAN